ncbi:UDP-N-acetylglucosamine--N-acetylmuramyl-(pentapeptide) pyrophosphoryl-undecaprenol N-acetylglucosamine transferase OS=Streptomyces alboniger OX=132473 GN=murG PE=3 SV=1 [Streptomyces alboniger]
MPGAVISFVGTERGLETRLIPDAGYRLHTVDMIPFDPALGARRYLLPAALLKSGAQCRAILRAPRGSPSAWAATPSTPSSSAPAWRAAEPHPRVRRHTRPRPTASRPASPPTSPSPSTAAARSCRAAGARTPPACRSPRRSPPSTGRRCGPRPGARSASPPGPRLVLFNGGSLGAARLTEAAAGLAERWRGRGDVHLLIKTGPAALAETRARLAAGGGAAVAHAVPYLDRMDLSYAAADLVVCRAGSATVAELAATGVPAVLVPYPHAPGDRQTHNARVLSDAGAGLLLPDAETTAERLAQLIGPLLADPARLAAMSGAADPGPHAHAAQLLAERVLHLAHHPTSTEYA